MDWRHIKIFLEGMNRMKLIVALGNVGKEFINTRHNIGFMIADNYTKDFTLEKKFQAYIYQGDYQSEKFIIVKPTTFMNLSGNSVGLIVKYYHINIEDILVIQDDMDLELGKYKLKRNSSSGGHNGIKSIINSLNSEAFLRLKIGIGKSLNGEVIDYVLGKMSRSELEMVNNNMDIYQEIIKSFILYGAEKTMEKFNKR